MTKIICWLFGHRWVYPRVERDTVRCSRCGRDLQPDRFTTMRRTGR